MSIERNENDKLPEDMVDNRARTYTRFMDLSYAWFGPIILAFVMVIFLWQLEVGILTIALISFLTFLGVRGIAKTFFVH